MDYFVQFITVLVASVLGPIGLNWYKNKKEVDVQRIKIALKLYHQLQDYCFILAKSINNHDNALATLYRDDEGHYDCSSGYLQWYSSIPDIEVDEQIYVLHDVIVGSLFLFIRESEYTKFGLQSLECVDVERAIASYCETAYALVKNAMFICDLLAKEYKITSIEEDWLDLISNRFKVDKTN